ncbi:MAG: hypothetical protein ACPHQP_03550 [Longimicrobiales bacterium]
MAATALRFTTVFAFGLLWVAAAPSAAWAQADVAGSWSLSVTTDNGATTPSMTLEQDGSTLTGRYSSDTLGDQGIRGTVDGNAVMIRFSATLQGQSIPVVYEGTLGDDGTMTGTIDIADGMLSGTFTATRNAPSP